jgi:hypothetical protein
MKLVLRLANTTATFEVSGEISTKYGADGIEVIESVNAPVTNVVSTASTAPIINTTEEVHSEDLQDSVDEHTSRISARALANAAAVVNSLHDNKDIVAIREALGEHLSDQQFDDVIAAMDIYVQSIENTARISSWDKRICALAGASMCILAGYSYQEATALLEGNPILNYMDKNIYSGLRRGSNLKSYKLLAQLLWPESISSGLSKPRVHTEQEIRRYQQAADALDVGYSVEAVSRFTGLSVPVIRAVRKNRYWANKYIKYQGIYPIGSLTAVPTAAKKLEVRVCKNCGMIIPATWRTSAPKVEYCMHCQNVFGDSN